MAEIQIEANEGSALVTAGPGTPLAELVRAAGLAMPCGGQRLCGKCVVYVQGQVTAPQPQELALLERVGGQYPGKAGYALRLACFCSVLGNAVVCLPGGHGGSAMAQDRQDKLLFDGEPEQAGRLGVAVDIGTTTITLRLYRFTGAKPLATIHQASSQSAFGADVISRIEYAGKNDAGRLTDTLRAQLGQMLALALEQAGAKAQELLRAVVTGNTTMLHFLAGLDAAPLGRAPFTPASLFGYTLPAGELFAGVELPGVEAYLPRCQSAFVGADITCGMLYADFLRAKESLLLVDVGTNGEMALVARGEVYCCATAAGPAFEAANISMGMPAVEGAVDAVEFDAGHIRVNTLGGGKARGICGTGLLSAVAGMLDAGLLDETGRLEEGGQAYSGYWETQGGQPALRLGETGVYITQQDIRNLQLAKAAIAAGIETLLHTARLGPQDVSVLLLAGGFGSYISPANASRIGLIPGGLAAKAVPAGNSALQGAARLLYNASLRKEAEALAQQAVEVDLSTNPYFMDRYIEGMLME